MGADDEPEFDDSAEAEPPEPGGGESGEKAEAKGPKDFWDKLQALSPFVTGVVLAAIGYFLTGSVNKTVQKSQLQFNYVKEMQELLAKLGDSKTTLEEAKTTAVALAAFGSYSIPPLLNEIQSGELNRPAAGEYGLRAAALADPANACPALTRVLENRTAAYNWLTDRAAIRILGSAGCPKAQPVLAGYRVRLSAAASSPDGFTAFQATLADEPTVTKETVDQLKSEVGKSMKLLEQAGLQQ
ncbi:MAG TPA: hypothetical protein VLY04_16510 [Bryobacteraceae bacterium]|nr:hypothetical protein [Bryobacteraceae bacterium]